MDKFQLNRYIKNVVRESIEEFSLRNHVRDIISEEVHKVLSKRRINESEDDGGSISIKRRTVMGMLKDDKYDHAYLAYKLWHPKDDGEKDTYRSLFSKKANGTPDADGAIRHFSDDEITKLYELMRKN